MGGSGAIGDLFSSILSKTSIHVILYHVFLVQPGFRVDVFHDGAVFVTMLPDDYLKKSILIKTKLKNIDLRALHPVDIVVTKIGRLDSRDKQDIVMHKKIHVKKEPDCKQSKA